MSIPTPGATMPELIRTIGLPDMIAYAGATWDWHRLHYDPDFLAEAGLPKPVVDGQLLGALLAEHVLDWLGPAARITSMSFRFRSAVFAGDSVRCVGQVHAVEKTEQGVRINLGQRVLVGDRVALDDAHTTVTVRT